MTQFYVFLGDMFGCSYVFYGLLVKKSPSVPLKNGDVNISTKIIIFEIPDLSQISTNSNA